MDLFCHWIGKRASRWSICVNSLQECQARASEQKSDLATANCIGDKPKGRYQICHEHGHCRTATPPMKDANRALGRVIGLIPARYGSTRFPGKALALIADKPLIQHVVERCQQARSLAEVIVATDDERIRAVAGKFCRVEMTATQHPSGSDRIAEVAERCACDAVVNIQGDEPLIEPTVIDAVAGALAGAEMSTAATPIKNPAEYDNPNAVKVVVNAAGQALYFSRRTVPYLREAASRSVSEQMAAFPFLKHLGIYGYRRETLLRLVRFPVSPLEAAEKLEQLRALENGIAIAVVRVEYDSVGVDAPEDVARVERLLKGVK